jgi:hypothetical protein
MNKESTMRILLIGLLILFSGSEIPLFVWGFRLSQKVFRGEITTIPQQLGISILSGIPVGLLFIIMALIAGIIDIGFTWTMTGIIGIVIIAIVLFALGTIGAIWRFFIAGKFRSHIFEKISKKIQNK